MKPGIPWSVKGIEPETREAAKDAARRSGMTLGEWLNTKILDSADGLEPEPAPQQRYQRSMPARDETSIRLEDIAEQLSRIARREQDTSPQRPGYQNDTRSEDTETIAKILNRVESNERQTVEAFSAVNERLANLGRQIAQARPATSPRQEEPAAFKSLETAVRNIVEHIEVSEKRTRDSLKSMQDRMAEMAQRATSSSSEQVMQAAPAFSKLETRLSDLANRVERHEANPPQGLPDILRKELSQLTERIEFVRESSELLASKAQTAAVQTSQQELREIEKRILSLLKEAQATFAGNGGNSAEMQKLRAEIALLNQRIDGAQAGSASERDVHALRVAVEQLSTRVAQGPDMRPIADMDKRLADLNQRLEQSQLTARNNPQLGELERRMAELDFRLNDAIRLQGDGHAQIALEQKISEVADRVDRTEHQLSHLETIERAINQLFESVEQTRNWSKDVAEDAANRMADRLLGSPLTGGQHPQGPSPELQALEDGLRAVRESAVVADKRNQETLVAVHETLEQIVNKLAELETAAVGQQVAAAAASQAAPSFETSNLGQADYWNAQTTTQPETEVPMPTEPVFENPHANFAENVDGLFDEPAAPAQVNPLNDWLEKSKIPTQLEELAVAAGTPEHPADDFIAAARRAQAASSKGILGSMTSGSASTGKSERKGFRLPFLKGKAKAESPAPATEKLPPEIKAAGKSNSNMRLTLFLSGLLLLAGVAAFSVNIMGKSVKTGALVPQPTLEKVVSQSVKPMQVAIATPVAKVAETAPATPVAEQEATETYDNILTGSLPGQKTDATLSSIVAEPGSMANIPEQPPAELGTEALRQAAEHGDPSAQFIVATRYLDGEGTQQDVTRAAHWYQKAATAGLAPAQYRLATLFERGRGMPKDVSSALVWYQRAAEQGNVKSMHNAAVIAAGSEAGKPDYDLAFKWFLGASQNGLKDSQFNLAVLYERGLGTKMNSAEALFWYSIAAAQNDADAQKRVDVLSQSLAPAIVDQVREKAKNWRALQSPPNANIVTIQDPAWQQAQPAAQLGSMSEMDAPAVDPVSKAQQLLTRLGFNVGEPDGKMGARTTNAIRLFQLQSGLKVTGEITGELISQLQAKAG